MALQCINSSAVGGQCSFEGKILRVNTGYLMGIRLQNRTVSNNVVVTGCSFITYLQLTWFLFDGQEIIRE